MSDQPFVSMIVRGYRQEKYVREAVRSAFAQTYENLEIVLSDDGSPDRTFEIMVEEANRYKGPHRLILNRNPKNLGLVGNLYKAVQLASGELLVEQDGDDISVPARTSRIVQRWVGDQPRCDLVFSDAVRIGADGTVLQQQVPPWPVPTLEEFARGRFFIAGACVSAYSRQVFDKFGPINPAVKYDDFALTFRALLGAGCAFIDEPLVYYRIHKESITGAEPDKTRRGAAQWAREAVAQAEDCLRALDISGKRIPRLRRRLSRNLEYARLEECSSTGSQLTGFRCVMSALTTGRPNAALTFLRRDVLWR